MSAADREQELLRRAQLRVGTTLAGKYCVERVLGVGGMASVYEAVHRNGHRVAIKILHPELSIRADIRQRFLRESHAANAVNHPGAVAVLDEDVADGAAFLVMEFLAGYSVEEVWERQRHRMPTPLVMAIGRELADVLRAAHAAGIIHRDIKPANLFITHDGRLKVLDFGIARVRHAATQLTDTGLVLGTPAFMAPEQAAGRTSQIDERTDVWAVGATLFTLLTGRLVHEGETAQHVAMLAATQHARSICTLLPDLPRPVAAVIDRALRFEKSARWPDADALRAAIGEASLLLMGDSEPNVAAFAPTLDRGIAPPPSTSSSPFAIDGPAAVLALATTTSRAVSSRDASEKSPGKRLTWTPTLLMHPVAVACASVLDRIRLVVGEGSKSAPPASEMAPTVPKPIVRRPTGLRRMIVAGCAFVAIAATTLTLTLGRTPPARSSPAVAPRSQSTDPPPQPSQVTMPTPPTAPEASSSSTSESKSGKAIGRSPAIPPAQHKSPSRDKAASSGAPSTSKPDCDPPFVIDSNGKQVWKRACF